MIRIVQSSDIHFFLIILIAIPTGRKRKIGEKIRRPRDGLIRFPSSASKKVGLRCSLLAE